MRRVGDFVNLEHGSLFGIVVAIGPKRMVTIWESGHVYYDPPKNQRDADWAHFSPKQRAEIVLRLRGEQSKLGRTPVYDGLCERGLHGLDFAGQTCDLCAKDDAADLEGKHDKSKPWRDAVEAVRVAFEEYRKAQRKLNSVSRADAKEQAREAFAFAEQAYRAASAERDRQVLLEERRCCPRDWDADGNCDRHPDPAGPKLRKR